MRFPRFLCIRSRRRPIDRPRGRAGFTLMEIMVSMSLVFMILSGVYGVATLVSRLWKKEADRVLNRFPLEPYLDSLSRRLARADHVRPVRTDSGVRALFLDPENRKGRALTHFIREGTLYRYDDEVTWEGEPKIEKGRLIFERLLIANRHFRKSLLKGFSGVTMEIRRKERVSFLVVRYTSKEGQPGVRWIALGGDARLYSVEPYLFQDAVE